MATTDAAAFVPDYSRQQALPQVGAAGQARIAAARVLVIGAGGLGCPVLQSLAGAGVGTLGIVDGDVIEASNLHRQPLYGPADIGRPKAEVAAERVKALNPAVATRVAVVRVDATNLPALAHDYDVLVDCTDSFAAQFAINDVAQSLGKAAILASVHQYEGQLQVVLPGERGTCLRCLWPTATPEGLVGNCATSGVLGPVAAVLGQLQALEVLKLLLDLPGRLRDELLLVNLLDHALTRIRARRAAECADGPCRRMKPPRDAVDVELALSLADAASAGYTIVDIRGADEIAGTPVHGVATLAIPMAALLADPAQLDSQRRYLLVCARGQRSRSAAVALRETGLASVWSYPGGVG